MDRSGIWRLSPAYDITFSYDENNRWLSAHQMTVNGKRAGLDTRDLIQCGESMGLSRRKGWLILSEVTASLDLWMEIAADVGIKEETASLISDRMKMEGE